MMDALTLYPEGYHPARRFVTPDGQHQATPLSRTDHPVRYYFIDFDLSVRFKEGESHNVIGDVGRDNEVPELSNDVPYNAFKDRKSTRLNSSHSGESRMPSSA